VGRPDALGDDDDARAALGEERAGRQPRRAGPDDDRVDVALGHQSGR
jgi:hypothetical protein